MEKLFEISANRIKNTKTNFKRYLHSKIDWDDRLIAIKGARGVGKTTLLLQHIKENLKNDNSVLFISLDDIFFTNNSLTEVANYFEKHGGKYLFIDEVHKYPTWSREIKNIYDNFSNLKIIFTGSSILELFKGDVDLSRRVVNYEMHGMSFREFIGMEKKFNIDKCSLSDILKDHVSISREIIENIQPIPLFKNYLKFGYFPYYIENPNTYYHRINNTINQIIESDLASVYNVEMNSLLKIKKLLYFISVSVPFVPNIQKLSEMIGTSRNTVLQFLKYLDDAHLTNNLQSSAKGLNYLAKPEKIYLNNTNLIYAVVNENANIGNIRETFFYNQLNITNKVNASVSGDFIVNEKFIFEIGGKSKDYNQIKNIRNSYLALDEIETGINNKIPLWLFGFLY
jgi:uncharacterized protein